MDLPEYKHCIPAAHVYSEGKVHSGLFPTGGESGRKPGHGFLQGHLGLSPMLQLVPFLRCSRES